ncbi:MAG: AAA domain-containing protein [Bacteroidota bacterium]
MKEQELARLFFRELKKIQEHNDFDTALRIEKLYHLLNLVFVEVTRKERLQFSTLFARIAYVGHKYNFDRPLQYQIHRFRAAVRKGKEEQLDSNYQLGQRVVAQSIAQALKQPIPEAIAQLLPPEEAFAFQAVEVQSFKPKARVIVLGDDAEQQQLIAIDRDRPAEELRVQYNIVDRNENFKATITRIKDTFGFPLTLNLLDVEIGQDGIYRPRAFVVLPDYLCDVSAISECFKDFGTAPLLYLLKKYLPFNQSTPLMLGNIANFFLDELMSDPQRNFKDIFPKVFRLNPLAFAIFDDRQIREIMQKSQKHFLNLKRIIQQELQENDIVLEDCFLEPSFYSEKYGLQGRLDVFYKDREDAKQSAIVELKSGKAYMPNAYGISHNHFTQTLLYDLLVKSVFTNSIAPANYILYSGLDDRQLRFAPVVKAQQMEAIQLRNQLITLERGLASLSPDRPDQAHLFDLLRPSSMPKAKGFVGRDLAHFEKVYQGMSPLERKYFVAFSGFIAREQQLAKTGVQGMNQLNGLASLWLNGFAEKQESFDIISHLQIKVNQSQDENPLVTFAKTEKTNELANFRKGDIAVLYPFSHPEATVLNNHIFKCTIIEINREEVCIRLRSRQFNSRLFEEEGLHWNIEHDLFDSGFVAMYRSLFQFGQFPAFKKALLLGRQTPQQPEAQEVIAPRELTEKQQAIFRKLIQAKDYFLLWGPPGTGKTSMMLKHVVAYLLNNTDENILLLAYTNRAVDEICEAVEKIDAYVKQEYLRIGSRYSTAERFRDQLLDSQLSQVNTRKELRELLESRRIYVGTVASVAGKQELLQLKKFDRVIIDEASQILEPMLVGMLPLFERFVLIGDHQQLPAVVLQASEESAVGGAELRHLGLDNLRNSLFERLFKRCQQNDWHWAYACLSQQGRMHEDIMAFPNEFFYQNTLEVLPAPFGKHQVLPLRDQLPADPTTLEQQLVSQRMLFIPTPVDDRSASQKTNIHEAKLVGELIRSFQRIYAANDRPFGPQSLGIITPYRAQIAQIRMLLRESEIDAEALTIDTVERYQGGARDIILISLCANRFSQLASLVSLSSEGVDRKLNVALTRARQHLVILGNPQVLSNNVVYQRLMDHCKMEVLD